MRLHLLSKLVHLLLCVSADVERLPIDNNAVVLRGDEPQEPLSNSQQNHVRQRLNERNVRPGQWLGFCSACYKWASTVADAAQSEWLGQGIDRIAA